MLILVMHLGEVLNQAGPRREEQEWKHTIIAHCWVITVVWRMTVAQIWPMMDSVSAQWRTCVLHGQHSVKKDYEKGHPPTEDFGASCCHETTLPNYKCTMWPFPGLTLVEDFIRRDTLNVSWVELKKKYFHWKKTNLWLDWSFPNPIQEHA